MRSTILFLAAFIALAVPALGEPVGRNLGPGGVPLGVGEQRGVEGLNNSGEAGYVTLLKHGAQTEIVTDIEGAPHRAQTVAIHRGFDCGGLVGPFTVWQLNDIHDGFGTTTLKVPEDKLLAGYYLVVVYASNVHGARPVACAHLYR